MHEDYFDIEERCAYAFKKSPNFESCGRADSRPIPTNVYECERRNRYRQRHGDMGTLGVMVTVTNVDEAGTVTLSTLQPVEGVEMTASLTDIDEADK